MKQLIPLTVLCLPACTIFGGLSAEEEARLNEHLVRAREFFNVRQYEKAIDQAERGLTLDRHHYDLRSTMGWAYLELGSQQKANNVENIRRARLVFEEIIEWRDTDEHDSKTIFGFAKALYNQARLDEEEARLLVTESKSPDHDAAKKKQLLAQAAEHRKLATARDRQSEQYFEVLAEGDVAGRANKKEAYEYLMVLGYRAKDYDKAILYGNKTLDLIKQQTAIVMEDYRVTQFPEREAILREDLRRLRQSETAIRSTLAKYLREKGGREQNEAAIAHLNEVIQARPNNYEEYYRRGTCYRNLENHASAREDFQTFLRLASLPKGNEQIQDAQEYLYGKGK